MQHTSASGQRSSGKSIYRSGRQPSKIGKNYTRRDPDASTTMLVNTFNRPIKSLQNNIGEIEKKLFLSKKFPLVGIVYKDTEQNKMFVVDHYVTPDEDAVDKPIAIIYYANDSTPYAIDKFESFEVADMSKLPPNSFPTWMNLVNPESESETTTVIRNESNRNNNIDESKTKILKVNYV